MPTDSGKNLSSESMRQNAEPENRQKTVPEILRPRLLYALILEHWEHHERGYCRPLQGLAFP